VPERRFVYANYRGLVSAGEVLINFKFIFSQSRTLCVLQQGLVQWDDTLCGGDEAALGHDDIIVDLAIVGKTTIKPCSVEALFLMTLPFVCITAPIR